MTDERDWIKDAPLVFAFGQHLHDEGWFQTPEDVFRYFEKPWKWTPEFLIWQEAGHEDT